MKTSTISVDLGTLLGAQKVEISFGINGHQIVVDLKTGQVILGPTLKVFADRSTKAKTSKQFKPKPFPADLSLVPYNRPEAAKTSYVDFHRFLIPADRSRFDDGLLDFCLSCYQLRKSDLTLWSVGLWFVTRPQEFRHYCGSDSSFQQTEHLFGRIRCELEERVKNMSLR